MKLKQILYLLLLFTASFDRFLNLKLGGFSLRIFYFFSISIFVINLLNGKFKNFRFRTLGIQYLIIWIIILAISIPNTNLISRNIGYFLWFLFSIIILFNMSVETNETFDDEDQLLRFFIYSFLFVSIFGILQFVFGLFGISILTVQFWKTNLPRINGFSAEPSYFATYLSIGWNLMFYLIVNKVKISKFQIPIFTIITISIILSSSRTGILICSVSSLLYFIYKNFTFLKSGFLNRKILIIFSSILMFFFSTIAYIYVNFDKYKFLFNGLGLFGTASHSSKGRLNGISNTFEVFLNNPIWGVGLGGVASGIAENKGITISNQLEAKQFEGAGAQIEVLAASGIIGFIFFVIFMFLNFYLSTKLSSQLKSKGFYDESKIIKSIIYSFIMLNIALSVVPNILRPYYWLTLGVLQYYFFTFYNKVIFKNVEAN